MNNLCIGIIYEISGNPYFSLESEHYPDRLSEFVYPSEINNICRVLSDAGYEIEVIDGPHDLLERVKLIKEKCSLLFNKSIGFKGLERKLTVPAICQLYGLPYIGSTGYGMTLARHKFHTNKILKGMGFLVPDSEIFYYGTTPQINNLRQSTKFIVKPNHESDALGISDESICSNCKDIASQINKLHFDFKQHVITEEYISGAEWKIAVIGNGSHAKASGCVELLKNGKPITDSLQTRQDILDDTLTYMPVRTHEHVNEAMNLAVEIHNRLELRDYSRCDFRLGRSGELYCMEVSTHPDIDTNSSFVNAALQTYPNYDNIILEIIKAARDRIG